MDPFFPFADADGDPIKEYEVDLQRAVIQGAGILRARPRIDPPWFLVCTFVFNPIVSQQVIEDAITAGGRTVGIGDYRIENDGPYGAFKLREMQVTEV